MPDSKLQLTDVQELAVRRALSYWDERWDWESPVLFGLTHDRYRNVAASWPGNSEDHFLAAVGALRELLHGASAIREDEAVRAAIGVGKAQGIELLAVLVQEYDRHLRLA
ncbi:hypothetical protein GNX71_22115 [Variovorax sp. RKNM96]|uniref:hypothetical protein n=1 Tax=Variovorax sp. RKNM96 TaxID=2681552 RepID=UPI001980B9F7|nr:hypothetical protein [Variovorax sp. RKNM96]QSI32128.1 hypothetical protein GNX71_22115 [Variovorax sp. RKNM96]